MSDQEVVQEIRELRTRLFHTESRLSHAIGMMMWHDENIKCEQCSIFVADVKKFMGIGIEHSAKIGDKDV